MDKIRSTKIFWKSVLKRKEERRGIREAPEAPRRSEETLEIHIRDQVGQKSVRSSP